MGVMDDKVLIFVNFDFGQCWRGTVHSGYILGYTYDARTHER